MKELKILENEINDIQKLYLELIVRSSFNNFDGYKVVKDLLKLRKYWYSVIMVRESVSEAPINLITLRDLPENVNNVDTLYILTDYLNLFYIFPTIKNEWNCDTLLIICSSKTAKKIENLYSVADESNVLGYLYINNKMIEDMLGMYPVEKYVLIRCWWD